MSMNKFRDFQGLVSRMTDTAWLVDCSAMPNDHVTQAHVDQIILEVVRRISADKILPPSEVYQCSSS